MSEVRRVRIAKREWPIVYLELRPGGIPVRGKWRSVIFTPRAPIVTGDTARFRIDTPGQPAMSSEDAVRRASDVVTGLGDVALQLCGENPAADQFAVFLEPHSGTFVTAHLAIEPARRPSLVWVVTLTPADQDGHSAPEEVIVDAKSGRVVLRRTLALSAAIAHLTVDTAAGGPAPPDRWTLAVSGTWTDQKRLTVINGLDKLLAVPADSAGDYAATPASPFGESIVNAFAIANAGLDILTANGGTTRKAVRLKCVTLAATSVGGAAVAFGSPGKPTLKFAQFNSKFAGSDPTVVLHELGHVILNAQTGAKSNEFPFEEFGASRAIAEGLADVLGLTVWNKIRRERFGQPPRFSLGDWFMPGSSRDYAPYLQPGAPTLAHAVGEYQQAQVLCGALLRTWVTIEADAAPATADDVILSAICKGASFLPHQGSAPYFCCVVKAIPLAISAAAYRKVLIAELAASGFPPASACTHSV